MCTKLLGRPTLSLALASMLLVALPAQAAPRYNRTPRYHPAPVARTQREVYWPRLYLGAGLAASSLSDRQDFPDVEGGGLGLRLFAGLRFTPRFAMELGWLGLQNDVRLLDRNGVLTDNVERGGALLQAGTLDLKLFLGAGSVEPYLTGGFGVYDFSSPNDRQGSPSGFGGQVGAGVDFHLARDLTLSARGGYHAAGLDNGAEDMPASETAALRFLEGSVDLRVEF